MYGYQFWFTRAIEQSRNFITNISHHADGSASAVAMLGATPLCKTEPLEEGDYKTVYDSSAPIGHGSAVAFHLLREDSLVKVTCELELNMDSYSDHRWIQRRRNLLYVFDDAEAHFFKRFGVFYIRFTADKEASMRAIEQTVLDDEATPTVMWHENGIGGVSPLADGARKGGRLSPDEVRNRSQSVC